MRGLAKVGTQIKRLNNRLGAFGHFSGDRDSGIVVDLQGQLLAYIGHGVHQCIKRN